NILPLKSSCKRVSKLAEIKLLTSGLYIFPIDEENLALKKRRLPEASLRPIFQKEKIRRARYCQDIKRVSLKLPNLVFVDEHSACFTRDCFSCFLGSVYSFSAIRRGVSNQNTLEYCTDEYIDVYKAFK
ncbi:Multiple epidermal growth factor-like domains protein 6, partial [Armadillidium vulgare]